uniref:TRPM SLOG domain-containing protein n=1 Tax=Poecilia mexicana TaxID=48701 RepID=A0A3B3YQL8_9TELE
PLSFFPAKDKEEVCLCGNSKTKHTDKAIKAGESTRETWNKEKHVCNAPTDAFGDINFRSFWQKESKYARVSVDTSPKLLYELLTEQWKLDPPKLVISVTGGAKKFFLKSHLKKVFYRGIIKIAQTTGAWIITGGTNVGVMRHVGLAMSDCALSNTTQQKIVAIGVAPWGVIHNRAALVHDKGCFPANYVIDTQGQRDLTYLDNNHTHFLLVDDGTNGHYGVEIPLRAKLEQYISDMEINGIKIPVVCVVLDGGLGTLRVICHAIRNNTPCVILEGSGRMADVIAYVFEQRESMTISNDLIQQQMEKFFNKDFKNFTRQDIEECEKMVSEVMMFQSMTSSDTLWSLSPDFADAILLACCLQVKFARVIKFAPPFVQKLGVQLNACLKVVQTSLFKGGF